MPTEEKAARKPLRGIRILLLDDDADIRRGAQLNLALQGALIETAEDGREGLQILLQRDYDVLVVDLRMPQMDGTEFVREVRRIWPWLGIVVVSGFLDEDEAAPGLLNELGIAHVIPKPIDFEALADAILLEAAEKHARIRVPDEHPLDRGSGPRDHPDAARHRPARVGALRDQVRRRQHDREQH